MVTNENFEEYTNGQNIIGVNNWDYLITAAPTATTSFEAYNDSGNMVGHFKDTNLTKALIVFHFPTTVVGNLGDSISFKFKTVTAGIGIYGAADTTGVAKVILASSGGNIIVFNNLTQVVLTTDTMDWINVIIKAETSLTYKIKIGSTWYGPYTNYNAVNWHSDHIKMLVLGTNLLTPSATYECYVDDIVYSWTLANIKSVKTSKSDRGNINSVIEAKIATLSVKTGTEPKVSIKTLNADNCYAIILYEES